MAENIAEMHKEVTQQLEIIYQTYKEDADVHCAITRGVTDQTNLQFIQTHRIFCSL